MGEPYTLSDVMPATARPRRRRWVIPVAAVAAAVAIAAVAVVLVVARGGGFPVAGALTLTDPGGNWIPGLSCEGRGGYADIREGVQVVITDARGTTVATGRLGPGEARTTSSCRFGFDVGDVPGGSDFYGVEVSHRGVLQYSADEIRRPLELTLRR